MSPRQAAIARGEKRYIGAACKRHPDNTERYVSHGGCVVCSRIRSAVGWKPQYARNHVLRKRYGLERVVYDQMLEQQDFRCAICSEPFASDVGAVKVDHCHTTGATRALLCNSCNIALGHMRDDPTRLRRAADYLETHQAAYSERVH